jgi:Ca2+-binding EF-hand superfamily protein
MINSATSPYPNFTVDEIQSMIQEVDSESGTIDFEEFV